MVKKLNIIYVLSFLFILLVLPLYSAQTEQCYQGEPCVVYSTVRVNGGVISTVSVNLTVTNPPPNATQIIKFQPMTYDSSAQQHKLTIPRQNTTTVGVYQKCVTASGLGLNETVCSSFEITPTAKDFSTPEAILYLGMFFFSVVIFVFVLYWAISLPYGNPRGEEDGNVIGINSLKYLKIFLLFMSYALALWIVGLANSLTTNFLYYNNASNLFKWMYYVLLAGLYPTIILCAVGVVINIFKDNRISDDIDRGLTVNDQ